MMNDECRISVEKALLFLPHIFFLIAHSIIHSLELSVESQNTFCTLHSAFCTLFGSLKIEQQQIHTSKQVLYLAPLCHIFFVFVCLLTIQHPASFARCYFLHRKEVIQPHLPIRLPCYDLTPIIRPTFDCCPLAVSSQASGVPNFHGLTGGVYKARERIHRGMLIRDY